MKTYELTYIIPDKFEEKEIPKISEKVKGLLQGGKINNERFWGRKKLIYPISKSDFGYYTTLVFETEPENIEKIESKLKLDEDVIRHLIVEAKVKKVEKVKEAKKEAKEVKKVEKPEEIELPKLKVKAKPKKLEKPKKLAPKKAKITEEIETEEKKMKALEEKLEEILKE